MLMCILSVVFVAFEGCTGANNVGPGASSAERVRELKEANRKLESLIQSLSESNRHERRERKRLQREYESKRRRLVCQLDRQREHGERLLSQLSRERERRSVVERECQRLLSELSRERERRSEVERLCACDGEVKPNVAQDFERWRVRRDALDDAE